MKKKKNKSSWRSVPYSRNPLNNFKKSMAELTNSSDNPVNEEKKLIPRREMLQKLDKHSATSSSSKESFSRNSIIVISDSDSETNDKDRKDTSISIVEYSPKSLFLQQGSQKKQLRDSLRQKKKKSSIILLNNDSSIQSLVIQEPSSNGENIAPSKTEDDIVELWPCLENSRMNKNKKDTPKRYNQDRISQKMGFVIDTRPNMKYLKCLRTNVKPVHKKQKLCQGISKATMPLSKSVTLKCSNESQEQYDNNLDLNMLQPEKGKGKKMKFGKTKSPDSSHNLREIVIDGCNVAMAHTNGKKFSQKGIQLVIDYFVSRGHIVKVFLPQHVQKKAHTFFENLYREGIVVFTPSRNIAGRQITPYDDRYILEYATACKGIVISSDQYRDLYEEKPEWRDTILNRLLCPTFVGDYVMFPEDPLGMRGPNLETFLRH